MEIIKASDMEEKIGVSAIVYASPKTGKTTMLGKFPGRTLIVDTDKGSSVLRGLKHVDIVRIRTLDELRTIIKSLQKECPYDNVCVDTLTEIRDAFLTKVSQENKTKMGEDMGIPQQNDYLKVKYTLSNILREFKTLTDDGVNVCFTAWDAVKEENDRSGNIYLKAIPQVGSKDGSDANTITGMVDIVGILRKKEDGTRYVQLEAKNDDCIAGDRFYKRSICRPEELLHGNINNEVEQEKSNIQVNDSPSVKSVDNKEAKS